jgi:hypothetical protein
MYKNRKDRAQKLKQYTKQYKNIPKEHRIQKIENTTKQKKIKGIFKINKSSKRDCIRHN